MKSNTSIKRVFKTSALFFMAASMGMTAFADNQVRSIEKPMEIKRVEAKKMAAPCVNPDAPCPGAPVIFNVRKLSSMKDRDQKKYVQSRLQDNFPEIGEATLEGGSGIILAILAANYKDVEGEPEIVASNAGCCTVTVTIKIKIGKK